MKPLEKKIASTILSLGFASFLTVPAQAGVCYYDPAKAIMSPVIKLSDAACAPGNRLVFNSRAALAPNGTAKNKSQIETFIWEYWNDAKDCEKAAIGLRLSLSDSESVVIVDTYRWDVSGIGFGGKRLKYYRYAESCGALNGALIKHAQTKGPLGKDVYIDLPGLKELDQEAWVNELIKEGAR